MLGLGAIIAATASCSRCLPQVSRFHPWLPNCRSIKSKAQQFDNSELPRTTKEANKQSKFTFKRPKIINLGTIESEELQDITFSLEPVDNERRRELKPHEVRRLVKKQDEHSKSKGYAELNHSSPKSPEISAFEELKDVTVKGERNIKENVPMLRGKGLYGDNEKDYFKKYFKDRDRRFDDTPLKLGVDGKPLQKLDTSDKLKTRGSRIAPKEYWYSKSYLPPSIDEVDSMRTKSLKLCMMNEARKVRLENKVDIDLWDAMKRRMIPSLRRVSLNTLLRYLQCYASVKAPMDDNLRELVTAINERTNQMKPKHYIFLFQALSRLSWKDERLPENLNDMALCWPILRNNFLIKAANALCKLDVASNALSEALKMTLSMRIDGFCGRNCFAVKWITVLELFDDTMTLKFLQRCEIFRHSFSSYARNLHIVELYIRTLRPDIYERLPGTTKAFLEDIRVTNDLLSQKSGNDTPLSCKPPESLMRDSSIDLNTEKVEYMFQGSASLSRKSCEELLLDQMFDDIAKDKEPFDIPPTDMQLLKPLSHPTRNSRPATILFESNNKTLTAHQTETYNTEDVKALNEAGIEVDRQATKSLRNVWSSAMHADISRTFTAMGLDHLNSVTAGPFTLDIFHPLSNYVIEAMPHYQFYAETGNVTAATKRRQQLLRAIGFSLVCIPHRRWDTLETTADKIRFLEKALPSALLTYRSY